MKEVEKIHIELKLLKGIMMALNSEVAKLKADQDVAFTAISGGLDNIAADLQTQSDQIGALMQQLAQGNLSAEDKQALADLSTAAQALATRVTALKDVVPGN